MIVSGKRTEYRYWSLILCVSLSRPPNYGDSALNSPSLPPYLPFAAAPAPPSSITTFIASRGASTPCPHRNTRGAAVPAQKLEVERIIGIAEKRPRPPIAALRHVMGNIGHDKTGKPGHGTC